jgi:hypothetical protein
MRTGKLNDHIMQEIIKNEKKIVTPSPQSKPNKYLFIKGLLVGLIISGVIITIANLLN